MLRLARVPLIALFAGSVALLAAATEVRFNRDIRPIFSENCFKCHGPDASKRVTSLHLDTEEGALVELPGGRSTIVPGDAAASELFLRVAAEDPVRRMPPAAFGHDALKPEEIDLIRRWIDDGAEWEGHWAFIPPSRPAIPDARYVGWPNNPIDSFILERLETERLEPAPPASPEVLMRRVSLDLTGVPPDLADVDEFLANPSPDAYESAVDRLLSSPDFAERMTIRWLDAARFADTNGYQTDAARDMWRWRDWVIEAFASNKPFNDFTIEQIAGDMLPDARLDQVIATGFNRNHRGNGEGGIVDAEYAVEYVVDRVDTTATVWLGLTAGCARCHDHKYDPLSQKEYYELFAYFNNVPEKGKAFKYGNSPPFVRAPTRDQSERLSALEEGLADLLAKRDDLEHRGHVERLAWETEVAGKATDWTDPVGLLVAFPKGAAGPKPRVREFRDGEFADLGDQANFGFEDRFSAAAWIRPTDPNGAIVARTRHIAAEDDTQSNPGWGFYLVDGKPQVNLVNRWLDDCLRIESNVAVPVDEWTHVAFTYDGTKLASGVHIYVNGQRVPQTAIRDEMNQEIRSKEPLRVGQGLGLEFQGSMRRVLVYDRELTPEQVSVASIEASVDAIAGLKAADRGKPASLKLRDSYRNALGPQDLTGLTARIRKAEAELLAYTDSIPTVMVMQERPTRRKTYRLDRGAYDAHAEEVQPGLPASLSSEDPADRLGFARWLVSRDNPLTARVTVNRVWQMLWGTGIVSTVEDFGSQGEWPTHPNLLDWLAVDFMESGWDLKALLKTIVTSSAYKQSSRVQPGLLEKDPENRLFARGPRLRLPAESVRDLTLTASGLLVREVGGPSVRPYQPDGLWTELAGGKDYEMGAGKELFRRSLYTFWKRAVPPPSMILFDSAGREACTVRSVRTNTPLQALNRMNDRSYMEASRAFARRVVRNGGDRDADRLSHMFRLVTTRAPSAAEMRVLTEGLEYHAARFQDDPGAASALVAAEGEPSANVPVQELAAYTMMASLVLNLDEAITRE